MTDIDNFGNSWQGLTHGEVEDAIKAKAAQVENSIPERTSQLQNDSGFITASQVPASVQVDQQMSSTSTNPVQNKAIKEYVDLRIANIPDGEDGKSAYEIACENDFVGSEADWLESLKGADGLSGDYDIAVVHDTEGTPSGVDDDVAVLGANVGKLLQEQIDAIESEGGIQVYVGTTDTENDTLFIVTNDTPYIRVTPSSYDFGEAAVGGASKQKSFTIKGKNLTGSSIAVAASGSGFSVSPATIQVADGVANGTVVVTFAPTGSLGDRTGKLTLTCGDVTAEVALSGTAVEQVVPIVEFDPSSLSFAAAEGSNQTKTLAVSGRNLEGDVVLTSNDTAFDLSLDGSTFSSSVTLSPTSGTLNSTVYVRYTAGSSGVTGKTITASSTNMTAVTVGLSGTVAEPLPVDTVVTVDGLKYKVTALPSAGNNATVSVVNGDGDAPSSYAVATNKYTMSNLVIPATIEVDGITYDVTEIGSYAFAGCDTIESISFGANINSIKAGAFYYCNNNALTSVVIPESIVNVGAAAFAAVAITHFTFLTETSFTDGGFTYVSTTQESRTTSVDFGTGVSAVTVSIAHMFALTELILRKSDAIVTCGNSSASGWTTFYSRKAKMQTDGASYTPTTVYVPASLLSSYQSDTNWTSWVTDGVITLDSISNLS